MAIFPFKEIKIAMVVALSCADPAPDQALVDISFYLFRVLIRSYICVAATKPAYYFIFHV